MRGNVLSVGAAFTITPLMMCCVTPGSARRNLPSSLLLLLMTDSVRARFKPVLWRLLSSSLGNEAMQCKRESRSMQQKYTGLIFMRTAGREPGENVWKREAKGGTFCLSRSKPASQTSSLLLEALGNSTGLLIGVKGDT